ncbi:MAG: hypothetical protein AAGI07_15810 [Bacteroidota bacterium]
MQRYYDTYKLDKLFHQLREANGEKEIAEIETVIWSVWMDAGSQTINAKMEEGMVFMDDEDYHEAIKVFKEMEKRWVTYSEVWNKKATAYYLNGEFNNSLINIEKTLAIEPRHFGALSGKATIYREIGYDKGVVKTLKQMQQLMPGKVMLNKQIEELVSKLR